MSFLSAIAGGGIIDSAGKVLDDLFTSKEEEMQGRLALRKLELEEAKLADAGDARQAEINLAQAQHPSIFVAGPRPATMWFCLFALVWHFVGNQWTQAVIDLHTTGGYQLPPLMGTEEIIGLLVALLGVSGFRTLEKFRGVARSNMKHP